MRRGKWMAAALLTVGLGVAGCSGASSTTEASHGQPAKAEAIAGKEVMKVTLTERAAQRVGIKTVTIGAAPSAALAGQGAGQGGAASSATVVPYSAVLYAPDGETFVYTVTQPLTYVREKVVVATVGGARGDEAVLTVGPPAGTEIVSVGLIELYGVEQGVGE
jgi:hypothetical protein